MRIGGPDPNDSIETVEMLRQKSIGCGRNRLEMLESLDITEEVEEMMPKTESKRDSSLIRRFNICFNDLEKSELMTILTSQSVAQMVSKRKSTLVN